MHILRMLLLMAVAALMAGCVSVSFSAGGSQQVTTRIRVFEVPRAPADFLVPPGARQYEAQSAYAATVVPASTAEQLSARMLTDSGLLVDDSRNVPSSFWPTGVAESWSYSKIENNLSSGGAGGGFVGIRENSETYDIHLAFKELHHIGTGEAIEGELAYQGTIKKGRAIAFLCPYLRNNDQELYHVVLVEIIPPAATAAAN